MKIDNRTIYVMQLLKTVFLILFTITLFSCTKEESLESNRMPINLTIRPIAFNGPIDTSVYYQNALREPFKISTFKFYISEIELVGSSGKSTQEKNGFYLIDLMDSSSQTFTIQMERGNYDSIRFMIGVDSTHNVSGAQTGALDPLHGMFWTWNTGYIFAKLEGRSPLSTAPNQKITYHIGGFKTGENAIRKVSLPGVIDVETTASIVLTADIAYWFDGKKSVSIASNPSIMTPGPLAFTFADNYAQMFSVNKIISR